MGPTYTYTIHIRAPRQHVLNEHGHGRPSSKQFGMNLWELRSNRIEADSHLIPTLPACTGPDQPLRQVRHVARGPRSQGARGIMPSGKNSIIAYFTRENLQQTLFYFILTVCRWLTFSPYH